MKQNETSAFARCLDVVTQQQETLRDCVKGRQLQRELLIEHIKQAQLADKKMLAAIDKDIADFKSQLQELDLIAAKFRREWRRSRPPIV